MKKLIPAFLLALTGCPYGHYSTDEVAPFRQPLGKYKAAQVVISNEAGPSDVATRFQRQLVAELTRLNVFPAVSDSADGADIKIAGALSSPKKTVDVIITVSDLKSGNVLGEFKVEGRSSMYSGKDYGVDKTATRAAEYLAKQR